MWCWYYWIIGDREKGVSALNLELRYLYLVTFIFTTYHIFIGDGKIQFEDFKILMSKFYVNNSPEEQQKDIEGAFKIFDKNGNGVIEKAELLRIATTLGEPLTEEEAEQMMKIADSNKDGLIDYKGRMHLPELSLYCIYSMYVNNISTCKRNAKPNERAIYWMV